jgi:hypothetical protein
MRQRAHASYPRFSYLQATSIACRKVANAFLGSPCQSIALAENCRGAGDQASQSPLRLSGIAHQIAFTFGVEINKDVVRRILALYYRPESGKHGPSWLTAIGNVKESLWSLDLFRCESILLKSYWVMVVMDLFSPRIIGFAVEPADIDGIGVCRILNRVIAGQPRSKYLSSDNDPLFRFHRWRANLRILEIDEIKGRAVRAMLAPACRTAHRDDPARIPGPCPGLESRRPGKKARLVQRLLHPIPGALVAWW